MDYCLKMRTRRREVGVQMKANSRCASEVWARVGFPDFDLGMLSMSVHIRWEKVNENIKYFINCDRRDSKNC